MKILISILLFFYTSAAILPSSIFVDKEKQTLSQSAEKNNDVKEKENFDEKDNKDQLLSAELNFAIPNFQMATAFAELMLILPATNLGVEAPPPNSF